MPRLSERLQDLYERAWCQVWRWQYIAVTRLLPQTADEIRQGGYDEGFEACKRRLLEMDWRDLEFQRQAFRKREDLRRDLESALLPKDKPQTMGSVKSWSAGNA